jgi:hypothetical protein
MSKQKKDTDKLKHEEEYVEFLRKRVQSDNYKNNVPEDEFKKTKAKYDKAKLKLKMMKEVML